MDALGQSQASETHLPKLPPPDESPVLYEELSKTLIKQTGTGISPVIGLSYFLLTGDPSVEKYKPWIWGVLVLLGAVLLKDVGGTFVPGVLKKPLDAVELFLAETLWKVFDKNFDQPNKKLQN